MPYVSSGNPWLSEVGVWNEPECSGCVFSLMLQIDLGDSMALREWQSPLYFIGTLLYESGWRKRTESQDKAGHLWVPADCELSFKPPGFTVRCWCNSQATFEDEIEERVFGQRAMWSKSHGNYIGARWNKSDYLFLHAICSLVFLLMRTSVRR